jgi:hypothetical protein
LAAAEGQVLLNMIAVYRALGGGWQIRCPEYQPEILPALDRAADVPPESIPAPPAESPEEERRNVNPLRDPEDDPSEAKRDG